MPRVTTARFDEHASEEILRQIAMRAVAPLGCGGPDVLDLLFVEDEELSLFVDWDFLRGRGCFVYAQDDAECRSRRVDLRGPHDDDPGPLPMEAAPDDVAARHLVLATR